MPAPGTQFSGPLISGPRQNADNAGPANVGLVSLTQTLTLNQNGVGTVNGTFTIPEHCQILDFIADRTVAFDSATSATLTIGTASAGTQYATGVDVKAAAGRTSMPVAPTLAQMNAMADTGTNKSVVASIVTVGATTVGQVKLTMRYVQTTAWMSP